MLSLLRSHWPLNRRLLIGLLPLLLLWFFVALQPGGDSAELRFLLIALATSATLLALAVLQSPEGFLVALPVRRNDLVRATYVAGLLAAILGLALPLAARWVVTGGSLPAGTLGNLALILAAESVGLFVFLPLRFRLGPHGLTVFAGLLLAGLVALHLGPGVYAGIEAVTETATRALAHPARTVPAALAAMSLLGLLSSHLACAAFARRTF